MTEAEWLAATGPAPMLEFIQGKASDRKLRLFAVACCNRTVKSETAFNCDTIANQVQLYQNIRLAEQIAEGQSEPDDSLNYYYGFYTIFHGSGSSLAWACHSATGRSARSAAEEVVRALDDAEWSEGPTNCGIICLREIFGNPLRPTSVTRPCLTSDVIALATGIYTDCAFDRMPILADALQDAGCTSADVLEHCRQPGEHVRGCWALDLVLGKE